MTKKRMIHDCIWTSESVGLLSMRQRVLWTGLITTADDQGRGKAHPGLIRAAIFPFDIITQDELQADLERIAEEEMLTLYEVKGKRYYQITNWWEYQSPSWAAPSDYPAPEGWQDRIRYHGPNRQIITENWGGSSESKGRPLGSALGSGQSRPQEEVKEEVEVKEKDKSAKAPHKAAEILEAWLRLYPTRTKHMLTDKLKRKVDTRMKDKDFARDWLTALERGSKSDFLTGTNGEWHGFDLYWFLKDDYNWRKVLAGNYDNKGAPRVSHAPIPEDAYVSPDDFFKGGD